VGVGVDEGDLDGLGEDEGDLDGLGEGDRVAETCRAGEGDSGRT
jgi:hypothetical protein